MSADEFCRTFGWSQEKHRKVAQRARARLRRLLAEPADGAALLPGTQSEFERKGTGRRIGAAGAIGRAGHGRAEKVFSRTGVPFCAARRSRGQGPTYEHISPHS